MKRNLFIVQGEIIRIKALWGRRPNNLVLAARLQLLKAEAKRIRAANQQKAKA